MIWPSECQAEASEKVGISSTAHDSVRLAYDQVSSIRCRGKAGVYSTLSCGVKSSGRWFVPGGNKDAQITNVI